MFILLIFAFIRNSFGFLLPLIFAIALFGPFQSLLPPAFIFNKRFDNLLSESIDCAERDIFEFFAKDSGPDSSGFELHFSVDSFFNDKVKHICKPLSVICYTINFNFKTICYFGIWDLYTFVQVLKYNASGLV